MVLIKLKVRVIDGRKEKIWCPLLMEKKPFYEPHRFWSLKDYIRFTSLRMEKAVEFHVYGVHNIDTRGVTWNKLLYATFRKEVRTEITSKLSYAHLDKLRYRLELSDSQTLLKKEANVSLDHWRKITVVFQIWGDAANITRYSHKTHEIKHQRSKIIRVTVEYHSILSSNLLWHSTLL